MTTSPDSVEAMAPLPVDEIIAAWEANETDEGHTIGRLADLARSQAQTIAALRSALKAIKRLEAKPIGKTGFGTGNALLIRHAQDIARAALSQENG